MAKVIFLGTNGWYDSDTGNTISILVETKNYTIILDAGYGIAKLDKYTDGSKPTFLLISHFHLDHIAGMHTLAKNNFSRGLNIVIQEDGTQILNQFLAQPFTIPIAHFNFETSIIEVPKGANLLPFQATFLPMVHSTHTLGVRLEVDGKIITYCPDTGYCENTVILAKNADLLITECAYKSGHINESWPHLNPELGARIALESSAKKLVLTHFEAKTYSSFESRDFAQQKARETFKESYSSIDGMAFDV